jgi:hypothetical protein
MHRKPFKRVAKPTKRWREGPVNRARDHFEIGIGGVQPHGPECKYLAVALVGKGRGRTFIVQFLIKPESDPRNRFVLHDVRFQLNFFLVIKGEPDPWKYAQYHCGTGANFYSWVHWSFITARLERDSSKPNLRKKHSG